MRTIPMPPAVAKLERDQRGYPIPFMVVQPEDNDGEALLGVLDPERVIRALRNRLCGVCGEGLGYWITFIGGPLSLRKRWFRNPPMHEACARYAMGVCPFLASPHARYRPVSGNPETSVSHLMADQRPSTMYVVYTRRYRIVVVNGEVVAEIAPPVRVEEF